LSWKNILKNTITQGRVKEIEDIDIDIEDDDCRRWLKRLDQIIKSYKPTHRLHHNFVTYNDINEVTEEQACELKDQLENYDGIDFKLRKENGRFPIFILYTSKGNNYVFTFSIKLPKYQEWAVFLRFLENSMEASTDNLIKEFTNPNDTDKEVFNKLISFYKPYAEMIKQFSKHCNNRVFFDDYVKYVDRAITKVISKHTNRKDVNYKADSFSYIIFKKFGGY
tara:strand:- start:75 stop:743 length:669 start_codon:yes stop_codon:yes gene_type:complete